MNWKFYTTAPDAWAAMREACQNAKQSIKIEEYIFKPDAIGAPFLELLATKASQGIDVKIICDMVGSFDLYSSALARNLQRRGVKLEFFNPISFWRLGNFSALFFRDHRKILIVDEIIAFTGSLGIAQRLSTWRETTVKADGDIVLEMTTRFNDLWQKIGSERHWRPNIKPSQAEFQFAYGIPFPRRRYLYLRLLDAIAKANQRIYLATPYFIPNGRLLRALRKSVRKGVDVRLMVSKKSDHIWIDRASHSFFNKALKAGIKIYEYQPAVIHVKTAVCDDNAGFVGSLNLDNLSLFLNHEGDFISTNHDFVAELARQFETDMQNCKQLNAEEWRDRPWLNKFFEFTTLPFHWWM